ncbi:MAG: exo-alpha-sialidase [Acidobacteria bacterium]|nr:exo-alpha-sialidase [Acidobacteriota bacterium]
MRHTALLILCSGALWAQTNNANRPTWWAKYEYLSANQPQPAGNTPAVAAGANVDASNECGPQSETFITLNPAQPSMLTAGANEIFRFPMRGYFSSDGGSTWGGVDLPLPPPKGNGINFGSDPTLAYDTLGNVYYGYIAVYFGHGTGINGTEMAVARSSDGGRTYPRAAFFSFEGGENHFNDKPMITVDTNAGSPFKDRIYIAWDAAAGGSTSGGIRVGRSSDHGDTFMVNRADDPKGPGRSIGAVPFVGPNGELYVAWNDYRANAIVFNRSFDGGATWDTPRLVAPKTIPFDIALPAIFSRGALVYPACDADRSNGPHRGRLYCSWMDLTPAGSADILVARSDDQGAHWSAPVAAGDALTSPVDRFNHWFSVDPVTGAVALSFYDTRNDTTGGRFMTDVYFTRSGDGGVSWLSPNVRVSSVSSNEHDCGGVLPCAGINYGNQYGDYEGLVSYGGVSHAIWTDSRRQLQPATGCRTGLTMEEVFTARIQ